LYPNPAAGLTTLFFVNEQNTSASIDITDLSGRIVSTRKAEDLNTGENRIDLDLKGLDKGIYFVRISGAAGNSVRKLIVQ